MMDIISSDQTSFIRGCHSFSNIRKLLSVVHSPASRETPEVVVVSLDAEKAFWLSGPIYLRYWEDLDSGPNLYLGYGCYMHHILR